MEWKTQLRILEHNKQWDPAIELLEEAIAKHPDDMDAYIAIHYLLMNLLVEEEHGENFRHSYYENLVKKYFDESYAKFSSNPEYLYYTGRTAVMSEWYFDIEIDDVDAMLNKASQLDPDNLVYQWDHYWDLARKNSEDKTVLAYIAKVLDENSPVKKRLEPKGAVGEYIFDMMTYWAQKIITKNTSVTL
jgi:tetratricopeptide (TPR) repeat protein